MAEKIVENIRLDNVIKLVGTTQPYRHRETTVRQMAKKNIIRQQAGHRNNLPIRCRFKFWIDLGKLGDARAEIECAK